MRGIWYFNFFSKFHYMGTLTFRFKTRKNSNKNYVLKLTKISYWIHGLKDFPYTWLQISFFPWLQTYCKMSFFVCPFWTEIWIFSHQNCSSMVKKLQLFNSQWKKSPKTFINVVFRHSCPCIRVAITRKAIVRISWYIPHFEGFCMPVKMQLMFCLETKFTPSCLLCVVHW